MSRQAHGLRAWLLQRFTAVYIAAYLLYLTVHWNVTPLRDFVQWQAWLADPVVNLATGLFILTILIHAWVGVRDVIMDYIGHTGVRVIMLAVVALILTGCGLWLLRVLFLAVMRGVAA